MSFYHKIGTVITAIFRSKCSFIEQLFIEVVREFRVLITISRYVTKRDNRPFKAEAKFQGCNMDYRTRI